MTRPEDYVNHSLYLEAKTFLHGLLVVDDKLAMAHGLEGRVPFLDNDLVDFAMRMPVSQKLGNLGEVAKLDENTPGSKPSAFFEKTSDGKLLLRQVMGRYVPVRWRSGEAGLLGARRHLVSRRQHRLRETRAVRPQGGDLRRARPRPCWASCQEHLDGKQTAVS